MSTFEIDSDDDVRTRRIPSPLSNDEDAPPPDGNLSPVSPKNKSVLSDNAALLAKNGRNLDMGERKWLQDKWFALDKSGDGLLDFQETKGLLRDIKEKMADNEIVEAFKEMDSDGCGRVDFDEFYLWFANQDTEQFAHLMLRGAHRQFVRSAFMLGITMFFPCTLIVLISGPDVRDEPMEFLYCLTPLVIIHAILGGGLFMDAFAPVMSAKAKATQLKTQEVAAKLGRS